MKCKCGSQAINHGLHGRDGSDTDLCDVCYWRKRACTRHELQATGSHPAPYAKFCESKAYEIEIRNRDSRIKNLEQRDDDMQSRIDFLNEQNSAQQELHNELQDKYNELDKKLLRALEAESNAWAKVAELEDKYDPARQVWGGSKVADPIIAKAQGVQS